MKRDEKDEAKKNEDDIYKTVTILQYFQIIEQ